MRVTQRARERERMIYKLRYAEKEIKGDNETQREGE